MVRIAYQGELGAFSELAVRHFGGKRCVPIGCRTFANVFAVLAGGQAEYAVAPYVSSLAGPVTACCRLLAREPVAVLDEYVLPIVQALVVAPGVKLSALRHVHSHPVALRQCRGLFRGHPEWCAVETEDTAGALREIMAGNRRDAAAIAGSHAAARYGGEVLAEGVQDTADNRTHFLLIERKKTVCRSELARDAA